jgi:hypothetical protein
VSCRRRSPCQRPGRGSKVGRSEPRYRHEALCCRVLVLLALCDRGLCDDDDDHDVFIINSSAADLNSTASPIS